VTISPPPAPNPVHAPRRIGPRLLLLSVSALLALLSCEVGARLLAQRRNRDTLAAAYRPIMRGCSNYKIVHQDIKDRLPKKQIKQG
jgi:hypothetical protein